MIKWFTNQCIYKINQSCCLPFHVFHPWRYIHICIFLNVLQSVFFLINVLYKVDFTFYRIYCHYLCQLAIKNSEVLDYFLFFIFIVKDLIYIKNKQQSILVLSVIFGNLYLSGKYIIQNIDKIRQKRTHIRKIKERHK